MDLAVRRFLARHRVLALPWALGVLVLHLFLVVQAVRVVRSGLGRRVLLALLGREARIALGHLVLRSGRLDLAHLEVLVVLVGLGCLVERRFLVVLEFLLLLGLLGFLGVLEVLVVLVGRVCMGVELLAHMALLEAFLGFRGHLEHRAFLVDLVCPKVPVGLVDPASSSRRSLGLG